MALPDRGEGRLQQRRQFRMVRVDDLPRVLECRGDRRRGGAHGARQRERVLVGPGSRTRIAGLLEERGALQQRRHVPRIESQSRLDRIELLRAPPEGPQARGVVRPERRRVRVRLCGALEELRGLFGGAAFQHAHAEFVEDGGVVRRALGDLREDLVGLRNPARRRLRLRSLQGPHDHR